MDILKVFLKEENNTSLIFKDYIGLTILDNNQYSIQSHDSFEKKIFALREKLKLNKIYDFYYGNELIIKSLQLTDKQYYFFQLDNPKEELILTFEKKKIFPFSMGWITLLSSEDYLDSVLILNENLKDKSKYPLIVAIDDKLKDDSFILKKLTINNIYYDFIENLNYPEIVLEKYNKKSVLNTACKIGVFSFKEFDKLIYIDSDVLILQNMDELFERKDGSILVDIDNHELSSLFVFKPKNHSYSIYKFLVENYGNFDGGIISKLWFFIKDNKEYHISSEYGFFFNLIKDNSDLNSIKAIHFVGKPKPWKEEELNNFNFNTKQKQLLDLYLAYKKFLK